jgi:hypothetical protein
MPVPIPNQITDFQAHWRICKNCFSLFFNDDPQGRKGFCPSPKAPASKFHEADPASWDYYV